MARSKAQLKHGARLALGVAAGAAVVGGFVYVSRKGFEFMATTGLAFDKGRSLGLIGLKLVGISPSGQEVYAAEDVANDALRMIADAKFLENLILRPVSGFRSMEKQTALYAAAVAKGAARFAAGLQSNANPYPPTAKPGHSNHQDGTAIDWDVGMTIEDLKAGRTTPIFRWLEKNAKNYGFKRLPSEPWHFSRSGG